MNQCSRCAREIPESETACDSCGNHSDDSVSAPLLTGDPDPEQISLHLPTSSTAPASTDATPSGAQEIARFGQRELFMILGAVAIGGTVTFGMLTGSAARASHAASTPSGNADLVATSESKAAGPSASTPTWNSNNSEWVGGERRAAAFELPADHKVQVWQRQAHPILVVRCFAKRTEAFVFIESAAQIEPHGNHTVRVRFDDEPEREERWPDADDHDALFAPDGAAFARRLTSASTMRFGYKPHNSPPVVAEFHVSGLRALITPAAAQCGSNL